MSDDEPSNPGQPMAIYERHQAAITHPYYVEQMAALNDLKVRIKLLRAPVSGFVDRAAIDVLEAELNRVRAHIDHHLHSFVVST